MAQSAVEKEGRLFFVGNGGRAASSSHMAIDWSKAGKMPSLTLTDNAAMTACANDAGYENVFSTQLAYLAKPCDLLIAISSSGESANILNACAKMHELGGTVISLSGFREENSLSKVGDLNFYINSDAYGFVEVGHLALCHAVLDYIVSR